jgi:hypothetical protein
MKDNDRQREGRGFVLGGLRTSDIKGGRKVMMCDVMMCAMAWFRVVLYSVV